MDRIEQAIMFATEKHKNQFRKGTPIPYIVHPIEVMQILRENNADEDTIIAGLLHDTIEDTGTKYQEILDNFGKEVAEIVQDESEDKSKAYRVRKAEHMAKVKQSPIKSKMVTCADKLSNIKSTYLDQKYYGDKTWEKFNGTKDDLNWYYHLVLDALEKIKDMPMYKQLEYYVEEVFNK